MGLSESFFFPFTALHKPPQTAASLLSFKGNAQVWGRLPRPDVPQGDLAAPGKQRHLVAAAGDQGGAHGRAVQVGFLPDLLPVKAGYM